jgi:chorismate mutase
MHTTNKYLIAGPCALESREQIKHVVKFLSAREVKIIRASLWKPRTAPDWDGLGILGLYTLLEETLPFGITPATEVMNSQQTYEILKALKIFGDKASIFLWIGSRNQNHFEICEIAKLIKENTDNITLMIKNQMWEDKKHWLGLHKHILSTQYPKERLIGCHRGFAPGRSSNPNELRNLPNYEMAMEVKSEMDVSMLIDPSHIAGRRDKVFIIAKEAKRYPFDGYFLEVHENVENAKTDKDQQLSFDEFDLLLETIKEEVLKE